MTVPEAVAELHAVGEVRVVGETIVCRIPRRKTPAQTKALEVVRRQKTQALTLLVKSQEARQKRKPLEEILKGCAIGLYSDLVGENFWICADENDAERLTMEGDKRGQIYAADEVRLVITIKDPAIVRQVHEFKRELDTQILPPEGSCQGIS